MEKYDHKAIEPKWQKYWAEQKLYETPDSDRKKENYYLLVEFPYPSGNLHVGHWYAFSVPDILARFLRMSGKNVLYPIGFDAFGLPAENAAIKNKINPRVWTYDNMDYMRGQLRSMGASFDWSREVVTCDPDYYRWTQWQFLQFFKKGLAYRKDTPVNWCPNCKTVLANEQVTLGRCERCGTEVEQRTMLQWNLRITDYADRLVDDLRGLDWPEQIKESQRNWIGRSEGAEIVFPIAGSREKLTVFTTRADTLFGATYMVLAPEHPLIEALRAKIANFDEVERYARAARKKAEIERTAVGREKTGVELKGIKAINPATKEEIPVFISDYVLGHYGTGALMAVPAHDERDWDFAKKFGLPIRQVVAPHIVDENNPPREGLPKIVRTMVHAIVRRPEDNAYLVLDWKGDHWKRRPRTFVIGGVEGGEDPVESAKREIREETGYVKLAFIRELPVEIHAEYCAAHKSENRFAKTRALCFELLSDEREEITDAEKAKHEHRWVAKEDVGAFVNIAEDIFLWDCLARGDRPYAGEGLLMNSGRFNGTATAQARQAVAAAVGGRQKKTYRLRDWVVSRQRYWGVPIPVIHCASCGEVPVPEKDLPVLLPDVEDYLPAGDGRSPLAKVRGWAEVKCPKCGGKAERETDTFDTFVDSSWYFLWYADPRNKREFASRKKMGAWMPVDLYSGGAEHTTMHLLYSRFWQKALFDLGLVEEGEPYAHRMNRGLIMGPDGQKMSKSRGNVIDPDKVVAELGADTVRMYLAFIGPYHQAGSYPWSPDGIAGIRRFLERVWRLRERLEGETGGDVARALHGALRKVSEDIPALKFNTAIAALMSFVNEAERGSLAAADYRILLMTCAPFAPHLAEELWQQAGGRGSVHAQPWPAFDPALAERAVVRIAVQINGKVRDTLEIGRDASEEEVLSRASALPGVLRWTAGKEIARRVYVPGRLVSFVVKERGS